MDKEKDGNLSELMIDRNVRKFGFIELTQEEIEQRKMNGQWS